MSDDTGTASANERTPLLNGHRSNEIRHDDSQQSAPLVSKDIPTPPFRQVIIICIAIWVPVLVASLDSTIVATLVGSVSSSFNKSEQSSWLGTSYLLSVCCFTPIYGRLCDIMGRKYAMLLALSFFSTGTLLCGLATSMEMLIAARALAGAGGGGLTTCTSTILSDIIPLRNRGLYQGLTNIIYGLGSGLGGPAGGFLNDTWGWRNAFLVQMPLLAASFLLCIFFVHVDPPHQARKEDSTSLVEKIKTIDFLGSLTLIGCVAPILLALSFMTADDKPFSYPIVWINIVAGIISGCLFLVVERSFARAPILPIRLLTQRTGSSSAMANFFQSITAFSILYNYPLLFQSTRLQSSSQAGLHLIPNSVALSIASVLAGLWMRQSGYYYWYNFITSLLIIVSTIWMISITTNTPEWITYIAIVPSGFGISSVLTCTLLALINSVPRSDLAVATGMSYLFRTTGQVVGVSTSGALLQAVLKRELQSRIDDANLVATIRHQSSIISTLPSHLQESAIASYEISLRYTFVLSMCAAIATSIACFCMENRKLPEAASISSEEGEQESQSPSRGASN